MKSGLEYDYMAVSFISFLLFGHSSGAAGMSSGKGVRAGNGLLPSSRCIWRTR